MNGEKLTFTLESYSSQYSTSYPAENAFDGSTSTYWRTANSASTGAYLIIKVDSFIQLTGFRIYVGTSLYRVSSFNLSISNNGVDFTDVHSGQCSSTASWMEYEFESDLVGKYIKITFNSASTSRLYVYEFELYGDEPISKYLIRKNGVLYKTDGTELGQLELTSDVFNTYGGDFPATEVITTIEDVEILKWNGFVKTSFNVLEKAIPPTPQILESEDYDMTDETILGIEKVLVDASDDVRFAVSFDAGQTWKLHTGETWATLSEDDTGMSSSVMSAISTEDWNAEATTGRFRFRVTIPSVDSFLNSLVVDYLN
jgi:hypothetical protein